MNKVILCLSSILILIASCKKDDSIKPNTIEISPHPTWTSEKLKSGYNSSEYVIQFPANYEDTGLFVFEGPTFSKNREDDKVLFYYSFCGPLYCTLYGDTLAEQRFETISLKFNNEEITLGTQTTFSLNDEIVGIFYFNEEDEAIGKYYMKIGDKFLAAFFVEFDYTEYNEVENIIKTILE